MRAFAVLAVVALVAAGASAQRVLQEEQYAPIPYQYAYKAESDEGSHGHSETSDGNGNAQGEYFIKLADGRARNVRYTADANGFVAEIETNELGTESKDAADAKYTSSAITGAEAALQYGPATASVAVAAPAPRVTVVRAPQPRVVNVVQAPAPRVVRVQAAPAPRVTLVRSAPSIVRAAPVIAAAPVHYALHHDEDDHHIIHHDDEHHIIHH